jgi:TolA-binding protein
VTVTVPEVSEPAVTPPAPHVSVPDGVAAPEVAPSVRVVASAPHAAEPRATASHAGVAADTSTAEALYRAAHELHFHGDDVPAALAAWDEYLAASPHGAFAIEARYNRALCLVKLGRLDEARTALAPFAAGEVAPAGYRRDEAARLIERIDHRLANSVNGSR